MLEIIALPVIASPNTFMTAKSYDNFQLNPGGSLTSFGMTILALIKKVSGENFTSKILTANLLTSQEKCVIPNEVRDLSALLVPGSKFQV